MTDPFLDVTRPAYNWLRADGRGRVATTAMVDAYVRQLLHDEHGDDLEVVEDGGYVVPVADGVRVVVVGNNHRTRRVLVTATVLDVGEGAAALLEALNDLNAVTLYGRYFLHDGEVVVEDTVLAEDLEPSALFNAIGFVAWAAEAQRDHLAERFGTTDAGAEAHAAVGSAEVELSDRTGPLGPPSATDRGRRTERLVNASGYL